ncbi:30S ribosomal protein S8 [Candidatus Roizmanbacteria bacterium RIFCSPLOWO2_02_FULL_38_10]|uniref:Small ribosomal subunit protein uS8 n=1 Tax=Candidatus Roizmanbacteria bacterium RIFCSPLOWO2_02_FULL_38_10 TaxID=1802074 RepID=A0A1F7JK91_9BACT|nr:MAG: 30S ribosomal protein S8 [Candidatus Roizmanbacteria bacterium RIFCSPLOWO2_02_FULL_38_10]
MNNPFVDLIIRIKNGYGARKMKISVQYSRFNQDILQILKKNKYITDYKIEGIGAKKNISVTLAYNQNEPVVSGVKLASRSGRRIYSKAKDLEPVLGGLGMVVLSTPKGVITDKEARKMKVGGELLFKIW